LHLLFFTSAASPRIHIFPLPHALPISKVTSFSGVGLISGLMWALWHYPAILFSDYNAGPPAWYAIVCFTAGVTASSFIAARLTRSEEHTSELQSLTNLVCRLLLENKKH